MAEEPKAQLPTCPSCGAHFTPGEGYCWMCKASLHGIKVEVPLHPIPKPAAESTQAHDARAKRSRAGQKIFSGVADHTVSNDLKKVLWVAIVGLTLILPGLDLSGTLPLTQVAVIGILAIAGLLIALQISIWEEKDGRRRKTPMSPLLRIMTVVGYCLMALFASGMVIVAICGKMLGS